ncbi:ATP-binding cassette domain-containing protein [Corynebacterium otitidis]|uniref:Simple sugar transport system ATP-binding protein n=1 Tax=Corynebacterium otitidis ATCC 51513 TaxID=883169 RepID=I7KJY9_9CORY|nr:ATP-binding cassette domain-containing protein [Corynebacterium otitidis]EJZ81299.1 hypothetical protein HMPREF9719_01778 [Corynebacterium otitidis ATCC 51513]CCI83970.1 simple sugar transport system ATP-binding protein [Corynebacterium otitidis ATCC 51513]
MTTLELKDIGKHYGPVAALEGVGLEVSSGEVTCLLGDNGAGKSTLIGVLSGRHRPSAGRILLDGEEVSFPRPRAALDRGVATVHQDLALVDDLAVWRNFFLGRELSRLGLLRIGEMRRATAEALERLGVDLPDTDRPIGGLSGGQRQVVAIARAVHSGARFLILDEPTAALGVRQSEMVLRLVAAARDRGVGVVLITHNPAHALAVGDRFVVLGNGRVRLTAARGEVDSATLAKEMAGGVDLDLGSHQKG